jgi:hypothetical protein
MGESILPQTSLTEKSGLKLMTIQNHDFFRLFPGYINPNPNRF